MSSQSSHHPQEILLAQFSLYVHKGGLKPDSFHFISLKQFGLIYIAPGGATYHSSGYSAARSICTGNAIPLRVFSRFNSNLHVMFTRYVLYKGVFQVASPVIFQGRFLSVTCMTVELEKKFVLLYHSLPWKTLLNRNKCFVVSLKNAQISYKAMDPFNIHGLAKLSRGVLALPRILGRPYVCSRFVSREDLFTNTFLRQCRCGFWGLRNSTSSNGRP